MKHALVVASLLLAATTVVGCSDDGSEGPSDQESSVASFCQGLQEFRDSVSAADSTDIAAYIQTLKAAADEVASVGVPDDMPPEAEQGFDLTIDRIKDLPDDATQEDVARLGDVSDEDQKMLDALEDYIKSACPELVGDEPSE